MTNITRLSPTATGTQIPAPSLLGVEGLRVSYGGVPTVHGVSFKIEPGEIVALVGESGSGKTTVLQSILGLLPETGRIDSGKVVFGGDELSRYTNRQWRTVRGTRLSLVPQDPGTSLNPVRTIGSQIDEVFSLHTDWDKARIKAASIALIEKIGLTHPELRYTQYPHQLSGGMRQRIMIAMATALRPQLIIADEPTSALDVTVQQHVLDLLTDLCKEAGSAVLLVTHDLAVAADRASRILVMRKGELVEAGPVRDILLRPRHPYTQKLIADAPALSAAATQAFEVADPATEIVVDGLSCVFGGQTAAPFVAVDNISFKVARGTTHGLVGESGSGKTTTARALVRLGHATSGKVTVGGVDVSSLDGEALRQFRRKIQLVYQNPFASLDPLQTVRQIVMEPLFNFEHGGTAEVTRKAEETLKRVQIAPELFDRRPGALSGGQRQRVAIARALVLDPDIVVFDEAVSALDVTVQSQILKLLNELQQERGLTYVFVSHDLSVIRMISHTVTVMRRGRIEEQGSVAEVFDNPQSDYARCLIEAIPGTDARARLIAQRTESEPQTDSARSL